MDVSVEMGAVLAKVERRAGVQAKFAQARIEKLTPMEWAEVGAGVRLHPDEVARLDAEAARRRTLNQWEAFGSALHEMQRGMLEVVRALGRGWNRGAR